MKKYEVTVVYQTFAADPNEAMNNVVKLQSDRQYEMVQRMKKNPETWIKDVEAEHVGGDCAICGAESGDNTICETCTDKAGDPLTGGEQ